ncbi:L-type lectin-domain containing receptor kinase IV.1 [Dichanthelium oligosanthes]|uniref:non-specific serine/threonine protein kinase n=1 Tax=Dichanthelium oligosanthes TaxID=888268 RepID=A0A1E5WDT6_9POAL|nr:L-type lectin-domain containing receptor kinase IV.1 [Dichanthelium oligosanthes]
MPPLVSLLLFLGLGGLLLPDAASAADEQFVFDGFKGANLSLDGMATVTPDGLLLLTNATPQLKSHAFYPAPLRLHRSPNGTAAMRSFSTAFVIGIIGAYEDLSSHGMAFVVAASRNFTSALPGQFLGLVGSATNGNATNHLFAVEFDTILNSEFNDMSGNHVGIDVNGLNSVDADNAGYYDDGTGAFRNMSLVSRKAMQVWVDFDGQNMQVNVTMAPLEVARPKKPLLSTTVNLSSVIDDTAYVGFSSASGILFCRHYVLGWSFNMDGAAPPLNISSLPTMPVTTPKPRSKTLEIVLPIASAVLVFAVGAAVFAFLRRRRMYAEVREEWEATFGPHRFSYKDLHHATDGFSDKRLLGIGGFGRVYRGVLASSKVEVAVKKVAHGSRQGMREFVAEVVSIGRLRHRNLVQLLGYCRRKGELLLVYDYMPNGSLDKYLYDQGKIALSWAQRLRVIKGVASGLLYLHEDWEQVVVHRDIKASNVLLDKEMNARLGDFGLARLYDHGTDPHTTHVVGTMGYMAPELGHTGRASKASDVFAFGAFMLEVACGRKPVVQDARDNRLVLVDWVLDRWRAGAVTETVDTRLAGDFVEREAGLVLRLGLLCSHPLPGARPGMRQVVQYLDGDVPLPELSPTYQGLNMLALMQDQGFDPYILSFPMTSTGVSSISDLSGGR